MTRKSAVLTAVPDSYDHAPQPGGSAIDVFLILRRQKWPLVIGAILGLGLGVFHYATSPKIYYAAASILISEQANSPQEELSASIPIMRDETTVLNELEVLRSLELAERVAADLELHRRLDFLSPPTSLISQYIGKAKQTVKDLLPIADTADIATGEPTDAMMLKAAALTLQKDVMLERVGRTFAVEISYLHDDPFLAADIANTYAKAYLQDRQISNLEAADRSASWLQNHIDEVRESANAAAAEAEDYRVNNGASNVQALRQLERRAATLNDLHTSLLARYEMITIEGSYPTTNGRILSAAISSSTPALPKAWRILAVGLILGLMGGLGFAAWREMRETAVRSGPEIRDVTGLPFLGYLGRFKPARIARLLAQFRKSATRGASGPLFRRLPAPRQSEVDGDHIDIAGCTSTYLLPLIAPDAPYCETIRNVFATLNLTQPQRENRVIAVGSLNHGEGRSTVAANIAQLAALEGQRVLLIDADLSNPEMSRQFGFRDETGLQDVLASNIPPEDAIFGLPETGLNILPAHHRANRPNLAAHGKLSKLLNRARQSFDTVVVDFPPLTQSSDLKTNLPAIDSVVLLAQWGKTSRQELVQFTENEPQLRAKTVGVLLNGTLSRKLPLFGVARTERNNRLYPGFS